MGAWIEIQNEDKIVLPDLVAPYMGAWIEINYGGLVDEVGIGRSLHGSVD